MATLTKRKYKSGNWVWEIRYPDPKTGNTKAKAFKNTFSKKRMKLIKKKIETELAERKLSKTFTFLQKNKKMKISEWFQIYLRNIPADTSIDTVNKYRIALDKFLSLMDDMLIECVTKQTVEEWRRKRLENGVRQTTINSDHKALKVCFNKAINDEILFDENPFKKVKPYRITTKLPKIMPEEDISTFFTFMKNLSETPFGEHKIQNNKIKKAKMDYAYFLQLYYTGMRPNEPLKFRWEKLSGNTVTIPTTKEKQERYKYLHPEVLKLLTPKKSGKIFKTVTTVKNMDVQFKKYIKAAGLPTKYTPYWFRHTFITNSLKRGINTKMVSEAVGHSSTKITEAHYTHLNFNDTISIFKSATSPNTTKKVKKHQVEKFLSTD